jgi:hypothetical protein
MAIAGIGQGADANPAANVATEVKKLLELQGQLVVKLIESAQVPGPQDQSSIPGLGMRIDLHI